MQNKETSETQDIRVLDYLKQKLFFRSSRSLMPDETKKLAEIADDSNKVLSGFPDSAERVRRHNQYRLLFFTSLIFIFLAQLTFELRISESPILGIILMLVGAIGLFVSLSRSAGYSSVKHLTKDISYQQPSWILLMLAAVLSLFVFFLWRNNGVGWLQLLAWLLAIGSFTYAVWTPKELVDKTPTADEKEEKQTIKYPVARLSNNKAFVLMAVSVVLIVIIFQVLFVRRLPIEMVSQQVETFLAIEEIRAGSLVSFFPRNIVSEPLGYYWLAFVSLFFKPSMRIAALFVAQGFGSLIGLFFLYCLARLLFNRWVGLIATLLCGLGFWPILQTYALIGASLIFPLLSAALFFLFRGLLLQKRNDMLIYGILCGLGLMTHKLFLIMPILAFLFILIWWLSRRKTQSVWKALGWFGLTLFVTIIVAIPLLSVVSRHPSVYIDPISSRIGNTETMIIGNPFLVFLKNFASALGIVNWSNRNSWVDGIPNRPALDLVSAVLFVLGVVIVLCRYVKEKEWQWLALLLVLPVFLVPSAMSLAFPLENPSLSRAFALVVPVFIFAAYGFYSLLKRIEKHSMTLKVIAILAVILAFLASNYLLLNRTYVKNFMQHAWNTTEMSTTILRFEDDYGPTAQAWVLGHPHWVDERAVAILAKLPTESLKMDLNNMEAILDNEGDKLFILHPEANEALTDLRASFPNRVESLVQSQQDGKDFILFLVPAN